MRELVHVTGVTQRFERQRVPAVRQSASRTQSTQRDCESSQTCDDAAHSRSLRQLTPPSLGASARASLGTSTDTSGGAVSVGGATSAVTSSGGVSDGGTSVGCVTSTGDTVSVGLTSTAASEASVSVVLSDEGSVPLVDFGVQAASASDAESAAMCRKFMV